jgi:peptidoglycan/LPS O-acetylase OafA/YrhL
VEGLRAVAVLLVVLYHARIWGFGGGYIGVDVFFVISGFVISGVLLRQVEKRGRPNFGDFYARRARRILPAAGLVALVTIFASYRYLGFIRGNETADDARWVSVFLANFHFASEGTNYFQSQLPPSPLQNYWSLAVEEQFYVVFPAAIALLAFVGSKFSMRSKLMIFTGIVIVASFAWSIHETSVNGTGAYFSVWTRAWELALGGFVAAGTEIWKRFTPLWGSALSWVGVVCILVASTQFSNTTSYPGSVAALPVIGTALVIAGGVTARRTGAEVVLGTRVMRWLGKVSYSIYLWHWPVLVIATEETTHPLSTPHRLLLVLASIGLAAATYYLIENPIRHSKWVATSWVRGIAVGLVVIAAILIVATYKIHSVHTI